MMDLQNFEQKLSLCLSLLFCAIAQRYNIGKEEIGKRGVGSNLSWTPSFFKKGEGGLALPEVLKLEGGGRGKKHL